MIGWLLFMLNFEIFGMELLFAWSWYDLNLC